MVFSFSRENPGIPGMGGSGRCLEINELKKKKNHF